MKRITDRVAFINMFSPGIHRLTVLALTDSPSKIEYERLERDRFYKDGSTERYR